jgi:predicted ATPase
VGLKGHAGMGKSRLVAQAIRSMTASNIPVALGQAEAFGAKTTYLVWRQVWRSLLSLDHQLSDQGQVEKLNRLLGEIDPSFVQRAPLLGGLLGLDIPENATTASFDAKLRKASLESLLAAVLRTVAMKRELVIILEDLHWVDGPSFDLLEVLVREADRLPVLFMVAYRPEIDPAYRQRLELLPSFEEVALDRLPRSMVEQVIRSKLDQQFGSEISAGDEFVEMIVARAGGNPFYVEELVNFMRQRGMDPSDPKSLQSLDLPESLHALVLSRVDSLEPAPRTALKVASVVGREFDPLTLEGVYPDLGTLEDIRASLETLRQADLVTPDRKEDESWIFRHAVTRDVAYESMLFTTRAMLHESIGTHLESRDVDAVEIQLDLLAHHFWHSDNVEKKIEYQRRAGEAAKAAHANSAAIEYFERLVPLLDDGERPPVLVDLGEVLELAGNWRRAEEVESEALALAQAAGNVRQIAWCETALAEVARKQGRYDEASEWLDRALSGFQEAGDLAGEGRVFHLAGTIAAQQGDLGAARSHYETSLRIREQVDDRAAMASLLSNLGIVAAQSGDIDESDDFHARALALRSSIGDRWSIGVSKMNLGMNAIRREHPEEARDLFTEARSLGLETGDAWMAALSEHNLANAYRSGGDLAAARQYYTRSVEAFGRYADRWALALLLEDIALLAADLGEGSAALELVGAADRLREELETPRGAALGEQLLERAIRADPDLTEEERSAARRRGTQLELSEAVTLALACCQT